MELAIRLDPMRPGDWPAVRAIYLEGIATGDATFEQNAPEWEQWDAGHLAGASRPFSGFVTHPIR